MKLCNFWSSIADIAHYFFLVQSCFFLFVFQLPVKAVNLWYILRYHCKLGTHLIFRYMCDRKWLFPTCTYITNVFSDCKHTSSHEHHGSYPVTWLYLSFIISATGPALLGGPAPGMHSPELHLLAGVYGMCLCLLQEHLRLLLEQSQLLDRLFASHIPMGWEWKLCFCFLHYMYK